MLLQFAVGGAVVPFVTLLLRDRALGLGQIGTIFACASAALLVAPFFWGMLADRYLALDRLFVVLNLIATGALLFFALQTTVTGLTIAYTLFIACFTPTLSLINALSFHHLHDPPNQFAIVRSWGSVGWILPFLPFSLWLAWSGRSDLTFVIWVGAGCCVAMAVLGFFLPYTPPGAIGTDPRRMAYVPAVKLLFHDRNFLVLLAAMFLVSGSFSVLTYYSPPYLEDLGVPRPWIGPVQAIGVVFEICLFQWQPAMLRRWNYATVLLMGCGALVLRHVLYALLHEPWTLSISYVLAGAVIVCFHMGVSLLVNSMARIETRATAQTLLSLAGQGLGPTCANYASGLMAHRAGDRLEPVFWFAGLWGAIAAALVFSRARQLDALTIRKAP
ncbi:MAG TPA: MFS transporter [Verrucomicrobiae bacterium]|nr:MFS transporter [Verrucomicrobiae bacterium]